MIERFLERKGAMMQDQGAMYKVVAHPVLLYGSKSWVVTGEILKVQTALHHQASCQITDMTDKLGAGGDC